MSLMRKSLFQNALFYILPIREKSGWILYNAKHLTGKQVGELFTRYRLWDYVYSCFEALHTTGANYIVEDIDLYIEARQLSMT